jgi:hypothetical protein
MDRTAIPIVGVLSLAFARDEKRPQAEKERLSESSGVERPV